MKARRHPAVAILFAFWRVKLATIRSVLVCSGLVMAGLVFLQVIIRYFTSGSVYGIEEIALTFAVWFYFIGAAYGAYARSHVSASLLDVILPAGRAKFAISLVTSILTSILSIWVTVWTIRYVHWVYEREMVSLDLGFPMVYVHASAAVGTGLMSLYFVTEAIELVMAGLRGRAESATAGSAGDREPETGGGQGDASPPSSGTHR